MAKNTNVQVSEMTKIAEMDIDKARQIVTETNFTEWLMADKNDVLSDDNLFRAAFAIVAKFETDNAAKRDEDENYIAALAEYNAKFPWLEEYRKGLKELNAKFGGSGMSDELLLAKNRRNSTAKVIADPAWGSKNIGTMNNDGSLRQPKNGAKK